MKKKIGGFLFSLVIGITGYGFYQYQKSILSEEQAITKAKEFLNKANHQMDLTYDTNKEVEGISFDQDTF